MQRIPWNIYCDESCHLELDRTTHMVIGALACPKERTKDIAESLRKLKIKHGVAPDFEVKWVKVSPGKLDLYKDYLNFFLEERELRFRAVVIQKDVIDHRRHDQTHDDFYYKMFFLLLAHMSLPSNAEEYIYLDIKDTRSAAKAERLGRLLRQGIDCGSEVIKRVQHIRSEEVEQAQLADLLIGAVGYVNRGLAGSTAKFYRKMIRLPDGRRERIFGVPTTVGLPDTKERAEQAERDHIARVLKTGELTQTPAPPKEVPTLKDFLPTYLETSRATNKESWLRCKEILLRVHILPALGHKRLDEVDYAAIEDFKLVLTNKPCLGIGRKDRPEKSAAPRNLSKKSINNCLTVLRRLLVIARKRGIIAAVPEIEWFRPPAPEFDFLTFEEADRLLAAAEGEERTMLLVALRTGLRFGELLALRWEDVDLVAGRLFVRRRIYRGKFDTPKNGKPRELPLSDDVRTALKRHRHLRGEFVFCDLDGRVLKTGISRYMIIRRYRRAGLRPIGWHVLRHTFASHLAMCGAPLKSVQELMGHATIQMTMRYAHLAPEIARESVQPLDRRSNFGERGSSVAASSQTGPNWMRL